MPRVFIIVPVHNSLDYTKRFARAMLSQTGIDIRLIIVDDGSTDGTGSWLAAQPGEKVHTVTGDGTLWWGGAINAGLEYLEKTFSPEAGDTCVFANNDVFVEDRSFVSGLCERLAARELIHPKVTDTAGREFSSGARIISWIPFLTRHSHKLRQLRPKVDIGTTRFLMFSRSLLYDVARIPGGIRHYLGDYYFTRKAKDYGYRTVVDKKISCCLSDERTGMKGGNIPSLRKLLESFFSIRSTNNLLYRYRFASEFVWKPAAIGVVISLSITSIMKFIAGRLS